MQSQLVSVHGIEAEHASVEVQRVWKGFVVRVCVWSKGGHRDHVKAAQLQRIFRGNRDRRRARGLRVAWRLQRAFIAEVTLMLQRVMRGMFGRRRWAEVFRVLSAAAVELQRTFRGYRARERYKLRK